MNIVLILFIRISTTKSWNIVWILSWNSTSKSTYSLKHFKKLFETHFDGTFRYSKAVNVCQRVIWNRSDFLDESMVSGQFRPI